MTPPARDRQTTQIKSGFKKVIITVTNVSESKRITFGRRVSLVGVDVTATLTDGDATNAQINDATWKWLKGNTDLSGDGVGIADYTPQVAGSIKARATYIAKGASRTAEGTITVRVPPTNNSDPEFDDGDAIEKTVDENKPATNVGARIVATDSDALTYTLDSPSRANFSIDNNGQLKTKGGLDYESSMSHTVIVTATDPSDAQVTLSQSP